MDVVIALVIFIIGGLGGFLATRFLSSSSQEQRRLIEQVNKSETALAQYKVDVAEHLASSAKLLDQMNNTCQTAMKQMQESTKLLQKATDAEVDNMPFFSEETQQQLAQTAALRHQSRSIEIPETTEPPLDYSDGPSGLFVDQKQKVTSAG
ncbi:YhcB family protein [Colwellia ponticola]|uniref:Z-ring associated protein G n=1 Tax=Colwellia ponticola TaxID=2304625 RepID=A0A8H2JPF8_9GAMM|nr:YhcB family protein [Colwellia ponticola]TMM47651.1 DUF1043 family protein [Colwellia ponticola]